MTKSISSMIGINSDRDIQEEIGIGLLGVGCGVGIWASCNSSIFSLRNFTKTETDIANARKGMNIGIFLTGILSLGVILGYGKKGIVPGIITFLTGLGFYAYYEMTLREFQAKIDAGETL